MHFIIADKAGTYGDNEGTCGVGVVSIDASVSFLTTGASLLDPHAKSVAEGLAQSAVQAANQGDVDHATAFGTAAARIVKEDLDEAQADRLAQHVNGGGEPIGFDVGPPAPPPGHPGDDDDDDDDDDHE